MKILKGLFILIATSVSVMSCSMKSLPEQLDAFVDKAELNCSSYDNLDWEKSTSQYEEMVNAYMTSDKVYSDSEKEMAARAIGRYHALLIKNGIKESATFLKELGGILPSYLDGFASEVGDGQVNLDGIIDDVFNSEKLEESLDELGNALENLFGGSDM